MQVAETVVSQEEQSSFITSVVTQRATESDAAGLPATLQKQEALGLERPTELITDGAYISGQAIHEAKEAGWDRLNQALLVPVRKGISNRSLRY